MKLFLVMLALAAGYMVVLSKSTDLAVASVLQVHQQYQEATALADDLASTR